MTIKGHFRDKVAIVTGGASGIGRALCKELGQRGAVVIVADIDIEGARKVASAVTRAGGRAREARLDVSEAEDVREIIEETASKHGRLDFMFNNAGIAIAGEARDMSLEHWRHIVDVNLMGMIYSSTAAYSLMIGQGFGHIVNISSLAGLVGFPTATPYAATKHAVVGLSNSLRAEAAALGVKVSVVCPGFVKTGIYDSATVLNAGNEDIRARIPFKMMDAGRAARMTLRGVALNRAIIVFPSHARLIWWLYRLRPALLAPYHKNMIRYFRALRSQSRGQKLSGQDPSNSQ